MVNAYEHSADSAHSLLACWCMQVGSNLCRSDHSIKFMRQDLWLHSQPTDQSQSRSAQRKSTGSRPVCEQGATRVWDCRNRILSAVCLVHPIGHPPHSSGASHKARVVCIRDLSLFCRCCLTCTLSICIEPWGTQTTGVQGRPAEHKSDLSSVGYVGSPYEQYAHRARALVVAYHCWVIKYRKCHSLRADVVAVACTDGHSHMPKTCHSFRVANYTYAAIFCKREWRPAT
jgi:hypothetical protein